MEYKDERSGDLRLRLFRGAVALEAFPVLVRGAARGGGLEVEACIIGASHAVQLRSKDKALTEVLACRTEAAEHFQDRLAGSWRLDQDVAPASGYAFASEITPLAPAVRRLDRLRDEIAAADPACAVGLTFRFPALEREIPETLLLAELAADGARVRSAHVYPGEGVIVWSDSRLRVGPAHSARGALMTEAAT